MLHVFQRRRTLRSNRVQLQRTFAKQTCCSNAEPVGNHHLIWKHNDYMPTIDAVTHEYSETDRFAWEVPSLQ